MIQIKSGTCGTSQGYKTKADGKLTLPAAEEKRLVSRGVADYVTRPIIGDTAAPATPPAAPAASPYPDRLPQDTAADQKPAEVETRGEDGPSNSPSVSALERMPKADLEQMAADMGIDISGAKNNRERAELIAAAEVDSDELPELEDGDIVQ